jgi:hypothetical protein
LLLSERHTYQVLDCSTIRTDILIDISVVVIVSILNIIIIIIITLVTFRVLYAFRILLLSREIWVILFLLQICYVIFLFRVRLFLDLSESC